MTRNGSNLILEGLAESRVYEAMSQEDIQKIDVKSVKPEKKDLDRAEGLKLNGKKSHEDGSPWAVSAGKMAKLIKDPMKLVRRSKAVRQAYGDTYSKDKEADVWTPFREALVNMGFSEEQISEIEGVKVDKSVQKREVKKTISTGDKPAGWTPFDENKSEVNEMNNRMSNIIDGLRGGQVTQFGNVNESSGYKTIAGVAAKVDKDGKIVDEKVKKKIEQRIGKSLDEEKELLVENDYVKDIVYESFLCEVDQIKYDDVSDMKVFKLDNDNACVIFKYEDKYHIQGVQKGDEDVNLEVGDKETVDAYIGRLKEAGFEEKSVSKEDMQKQFDKISEDFINENSQIFEKIGDRKKFSKHEERVGNTIRRGDKKIAGYNFPNFVSDKENNDANKKVGQKLGGKLVSTAAKGAIVKGLASKGILTGLIGAGVTGSKSVAGAALAVKVCTAIPMAGFGGLALAGVGVAAGATIAHKIVKKNIEKAETNVNRGYKTSWGRYFKKDGNEWVQIDKDEYNKLKEKDQKANESKKVVEAFITESDIKGISKEKVLDIAGIDVKKTGKDDIKKSIKKLLKVSESVNEDDWITIRGTHTLVDGDGNIKNDKLKKKIEATSKGKSEKSTGSSSVKIDKGRISKSKKSFRDKLSKMSADDFDGDRLAEDFKSMSDEIDEVAKNSIKDDEFASELYDSPMFGLAVTALVSNISADDVDKMSDGDVKETLGIDDASSDEIKSLKKSMKSCINGFMAVASEPNIDYSDDEDTVLKKSKDNVLKKADGLDEMLCSKAELASTLSSIHKRYSGNS